jgi:hypothetical protein
VATKKDFSCRHFFCGHFFWGHFFYDHGAQNFYSTAQTFTIAGGHGGERRATGARLAKRKIAAEDQISRIGKGIGNGCEQFALAISTRTVGKHQSVTVGLRGFVEKATDCGLG